MSKRTHIERVSAWRQTFGPKVSYDVTVAGKKGKVGFKYERTVCVSDPVEAVQTAIEAALETISSPDIDHEEEAQ